MKPVPIVEYTSYRGSADSKAFREVAVGYAARSVEFANLGRQGHGKLGGTTAPDVLKLSDWLQVGRADAVSLSAQMIRDESIRKRPDLLFIHGSVGKDFRPSYAYINGRVFPHPAFCVVAGIGHEVVLANDQTWNDVVADHETSSATAYYVRQAPAATRAWTRVVGNERLPTGIDAAMPEHVTLWLAYHVTEQGVARSCEWRPASTSAHAKTGWIRRRETNTRAGLHTASVVAHYVGARLALLVSPLRVGVRREARLLAAATPAVAVWNSVRVHAASLIEVVLMGRGTRRPRPHYSTLVYG